MALAQMFKPLRLYASAAGGSTPRPRDGTPETPSGARPNADSPDAARSVQEEGWMALLEIVFAETGWPDADG